MVKLWLLLGMPKYTPLIRVMQRKDWKQVQAIYRDGLSTGLAAFMFEAPNWIEWNAQHLKEGRLVSTKKNDHILGWAALQPVPDTWGAAGVAEVSVYVKASVHREGIGLGLLRELLKVSEIGGYWTLQAQMMAENNASVATFRKAGFRKVGVRERYGQFNGIWHDVILVERRSQSAGGSGLPTKACS